MAVLLTGASGFLGTALISKLLSKGHKIYGLSRHPPEARENLIPLVGDITEPNLGLKEVPEDIHTIHHLAAIHRLGEDKDGSIWKTNVDGTKNVIDFCLRHDIPRLYFTSTAYTMSRNTYEQSKALCETLIEESKIPKVTIFKPSIIMGTEEHFYPGHVSQFITLVIKLTHGVGVIKEKTEGTLRLPPLQLVLKLRGNPEGRLNLVTVDRVADAMAEITNEGTFWLTHPNPPKIKQLVDWIGEFIAVQIRIETEDFKPSALDLALQKMATAFKPYLAGDDFPSNIKCPSITKEFIHQTIRRTVYLDQSAFRV